MAEDDAKPISVQLNSARTASSHVTDSNEQPALTNRTTASERPEAETVNMAQDSSSDIHSENSDRLITVRVVEVKSDEPDHSTQTRDAKWIIQEHGRRLELQDLASSVALESVSVKRIISSETAKASSGGAAEGYALVNGAALVEQVNSGTRSSLIAFSASVTAQPDTIWGNGGMDEDGKPLEITATVVGRLIQTLRFPVHISIASLHPELELDESTTAGDTLTASGPHKSIPMESMTLPGVTLSTAEATMAVIGDFLRRIPPSATPSLVLTPSMPAGQEKSRSWSQSHLRILRLPIADSGPELAKTLSMALSARSPQSVAALFSVPSLTSTSSASSIMAAIRAVSIANPKPMKLARMSSTLSTMSTASNAGGLRRRARSSAALAASVTKNASLYSRLRSEVRGRVEALVLADGLHRILANVQQERDEALDLAESATKERWEAAAATVEANLATADAQEGAEAASAAAAASVLAAQQTAESAQAESEAAAAALKAATNELETLRADNAALIKELSATRRASEGARKAVEEAENKAADLGLELLALAASKRRMEAAAQEAVAGTSSAAVALADGQAQTDEPWSGNMDALETMSMSSRLSFLSAAPQTDGGPDPRDAVIEGLLADKQELVAALEEAARSAAATAAASRAVRSPTSVKSVRSPPPARRAPTMATSATSPIAWSPASVKKSPVIPASPALNALREENAAAAASSTNTTLTPTPQHIKAMAELEKSLAQARTKADAAEAAKKVIEKAHSEANIKHAQDISQLKRVITSYEMALSKATSLVARRNSGGGGSGGRDNGKGMRGSSRTMSTMAKSSSQQNASQGKVARRKRGTSSSRPGVRFAPDKKHPTKTADSSLFPTSLPEMKENNRPLPGHFPEQGIW